MTKVWVVGTRDAESNTIMHVFSTEVKALVEWENIRKDLVKKLEEDIELHRGRVGETISNAFMRILERRHKNLQIKDPALMDNYPQEEPFMHEMELE